MIDLKKVQEFLLRSDRIWHRHRRQIEGKICLSLSEFRRFGVLQILLAWGKNVFLLKSIRWQLSDGDRKGLA